VKILIFNQDWFTEEFRAAGHHVMTCGLRGHLEVPLKVPLRRLDDIISSLPGGLVPDVIIVHDESGPIFFTGIEDTAIPVIFLSVDIHHHYAVHTMLTHVFDAVFVVQKDYLHLFEKGAASLEWMPLWASRYFEASTEKQYGATFVGTLDRRLNPDRVDFFDQLKTKVPIEVRSGNFWEIFPVSEIVINQTVKGDLNFRVFEALMSGAMLLTEKQPNGLEDLFTPDEHLVLYSKGNVEEAAGKIEHYLGNPGLCREIGLAGRSEVLKRHLPQHRAARFLECIKKVRRTSSPRRSFSMIPMYLWLTHTLEKKDTKFAQAAAAHTLSVVKKGILATESVDDDLSWHLVRACFEHDRLIPGGFGELIIQDLIEAYPECKLSSLAIIWRRLNEGKRDEVNQRIQDLGLEPSSKLFKQIDNLMMEMLTSKQKVESSLPRNQF
jgi:hypothetical protein